MSAGIPRWHHYQICCKCTCCDRDQSQSLNANTPPSAPAPSTRARPLSAASLPQCRLLSVQRSWFLSCQLLWLSRRTTPAPSLLYPLTHSLPQKQRAYIAIVGGTRALCWEAEHRRCQRASGPLDDTAALKRSVPMRDALPLWVLVLVLVPPQTPIEETFESSPTHGPLRNSTSTLPLLCAETHLPPRG